MKIAKVIRESIEVETFTGHVARFGDAVGVEERDVAARQIHAAVIRHVSDVLSDPEPKSVRRQTLDVARDGAVNQQIGMSAGVHHLSVAVEFRYDQCHETVLC